MRSERPPPPPITTVVCLFGNFNLCSQVKSVKASSTINGLCLTQQDYLKNTYSIMLDIFHTVGEFHPIKKYLDMDRSSVVLASSQMRVMRASN